MRARREHRGAGPDHERARGRREQEIAEVEARGDARGVDLHARERVLPERRGELLRGGEEGAADGEPVVDEEHLQARGGGARGDHHAGEPGADDGDVDLDPAGGLDVLDLAGQAAEPGHLAREGLHHVGEAGDAGHEVVVIDPCAKNQSVTRRKSALREPMTFCETMTSPRARAAGTSSRWVRRRRGRGTRRSRRGGSSARAAGAAWGCGRGWFCPGRGARGRGARLARRGSPRRRG